MTICDQGLCFKNPALSVIAHRMPQEHFQWSFKFQCKTVKICFCDEIFSCREIDGHFAVHVF